MEKLFQLTFTTGQFFFIIALSLFVHVSIWSLFAIRKKRADLADVAWGLGFCLVTWLCFFLSEKTVYSLIINLLITTWAFRLSIHIYLRNRNRKEDFRYQNLKNQWGENISLRIFVRVFLLQGVILYLVSLPIIWINTHSEDLTFNALSFSIPFWLFGFLFETIGDHQLLRFQNNPSNRGKLLTTGLWSYVRHPNYLGEITQWWAIWSITLFLPYGWTLIVSPILITYLIVKVSGIAPLEEKMKTHPDFAQYAKITPSLIPFPLVNGSLYILAWIIIVWFGGKNSSWIPIFTILINYSLQTYLFSKYEKKSLLICIPLSIYALFLAVIQETVFIHLDILDYPGQKIFPPFWLLSLYPLFALTLNSSLSFLNRNLPLAFCLGGLGALLSYLGGEQLGSVQLLSPLAYPITFVSWGTYLILLILLNRKLIVLRETYTDPLRNKKTLTVFFDNQCPVCFREMKGLKKRKQTGEIIYACPQSDEDLKKITDQFTYKQAMETIYAIDPNGKILKGTDVLSELYSRTDLPILAIWLQAPMFRQVFILAYAIWAKLRRRINPSY